MELELQDKEIQRNFCQSDPMASKYKGEKMEVFSKSPAMSL